MIAAVALRIVAAAVLVAGVAGSSAADPPAAQKPPHSKPPAEVQSPMAAVLTASSPRHELPLAVFAVAPTAVTLTIAAIDNPSSQAFSLAAGVVWTSRGGRRTVEPLRPVTPFPPSRPGSFVIMLDAPVRSLLGHSDGHLALQLAVQPIAADRPLAEPLRVSISAPVWR